MDEWFGLNRPFDSYVLSYLAMNASKAGVEFFCRTYITIMNTYNLRFNVTNVLGRGNDSPLIPNLEPVE